MNRFATRQEDSTYEFINDYASKYLKSGFVKYQFSPNDSVEKYKDVIKTYRRKGLLAIYPKFFNGYTMSNDFAVHSMDTSFAIECKERTTSTISPSELNKEVVIRKGKLIEKQMIFFFDGAYSDKKQFNLSTIEMPDNYRIIYDVNELKYLFDFL